MLQTDSRLCWHLHQSKLPAGTEGATCDQSYCVSGQSLSGVILWAHANTAAKNANGALWQSAPLEAVGSWAYPILTRTLISPSQRPPPPPPLLYPRPTCPTFSVLKDSDGHTVMGLHHGINCWQDLFPLVLVHPSPLIIIRFALTVIFVLLHLSHAHR